MHAVWPSLRWADFAENLREFARRVDETETRRVIVLEDAIACYCALEADCGKPEDLSSPDDGVYVIYTSGT